MSTNNTKTRIIIHPPSHPLLSLIYFPLGVVVAFGLSYLVAFTAYRIPHPYDYYVFLASILIALSPGLSYINIILKEFESGPEEIVLRLEYVSVYGIPVPIPALVKQRQKLILAINVGGAIIPVVVSLVFIKVVLSVIGSYIAPGILASIIITALATFLFSRVIPGVGIAVPSLLPPLVATITVSLLFGAGLIPGLIAYSSGTLGSLLGADVFRLLKDIDKIRTGFASIGGVGVFDGIFLSGFLALLLTI